MKNHSAFQSFPYVFPHVGKEITVLEVQYFILKLKHFQQISQCSLIYRVQAMPHPDPITKKHCCYPYLGENLASEVLC